MRQEIRAEQAGWNTAICQLQSRWQAENRMQLCNPIGTDLTCQSQAGCTGRAASDGPVWVDMEALALDFTTTVVLLSCSPVLQRPIRLQDASLPALFFAFCLTDFPLSSSFSSFTLNTSLC